MISKTLKLLLCEYVNEYVKYVDDYCLLLIGNNLSLNNSLIIKLYDKLHGLEISEWWNCWIYIEFMLNW